MGYYEGSINDLCYGNNGNNGFGSDWGDLAALIVVAGLFGWGNGGIGGFGGGNRGNCATVQDVASGFSTSEIMSDLNDIILGQASMQNFINQGFAGVNQTVTNGFAGVNNAICTLGYQNQAGFNALSTQLAQCCCDTRSAIADVKYANERNTCQIIDSQNANTRAILDFLTSEKISALQAENSGLKAQISNDRQSMYITDTILDRLSPCPKPSYVVQPPQPVTFATNCCGNTAYAGYGYGSCGASVQ